MSKSLKALFRTLNSWPAVFKDFRRLPSRSMIQPTFAQVTSRSDLQSSVCLTPEITMLNLLDLSAELLMEVLEHTVLVVGLTDAVKLRLVCSTHPLPKLHNRLFKWN